PEATPAPAKPPLPTIHEAELASGASGAVIRGPEIDFAIAVARRQTQENVVVCGNDLRANARLAARIEAAVGRYVRGKAHRRLAGPFALPHYQQEDEDHGGHTFYETPNVRAVRRQP